MAMDRRSFDTGTSQQVQSDLQGIIGRLESVISQRDQAVQHAMADFQADGVSEDYMHVEQRWKSAASEVRQIIHLLKQTMTNNDDTAHGAMSRARSAVQGIG